MAEGWKMMQPVLPCELDERQTLEEAVAEAIVQDGDLSEKRFCGDEISGFEGKTLDFSGCVFERCTFGKMEFKRMSFVDCVFDKCEMSNMRMVNAAFQRVSFRNCRMTGLEMIKGVCMNTAFESCMLDYLSLSETKLDRATFTNCRMRESLWSEVKLLKARFEQADLQRAQWMRTPLAGIDMSSCQITGWGVTLYDLRGVKVTAAQVIELSGLLGVEIVP